VWIDEFIQLWIKDQRCSTQRDDDDKRSNQQACPQMNPGDNFTRLDFSQLRYLSPVSTIGLFKGWLCRESQLSKHHIETY
jgi:hypothetical protein